MQHHQNPLDFCLLHFFHGKWVPKMEFQLFTPGTWLFIDYRGVPLRYHRRVVCLYWTIDLILFPIVPLVSTWRCLLCLTQHWIMYMYYCWILLNSNCLFLFCLWNFYSFFSSALLTSLILTPITLNHHVVSTTMQTV